MTYIPKNPKPLGVKSAQPDAPHLSSHELVLAQQTTALWHRSNIGHHSWFWEDYTTAPRATISSVGSYQSFVFNPTASGGPSSYNLNLPWLYHKQARLIRGIAYVASCPALLCVRLRVRDMVDSYAAFDGPGSVPQSSSLNPYAKWIRDQSSHGATRIYRSVIEIAPDSTVTSTGRTFGIGVQVQSPAEAWAYGTSSFYVYLIGLFLENVGPLEI